MPAAGPPLEMALAVKAWNLLGGAVDWVGLPIVAELLGVVDLELLIRQMVLIREFKQQQ